MSRVAVAVVVAVSLGAAGCSFDGGVGLPCRGDDNCPYGLACVAERCAGAPAGLAIDELRDANVEPGSAPQVVGGDVLYTSLCALRRYRPEDGSDVALALAEAACYRHVDAVVAGGVVRGVVSGDGAVSAFVVDGDRAVVTAFAGGDRSGGSVFVDDAGVVRAGWVRALGSDDAIEEVVVDGVAVPVVFGALADRALSELALTSGDDGGPLRFLLERPREGGAADLIARSDDIDAPRNIAGPVAGAIDAVRCGGVTLVAFRAGAALRIPEVHSDGVVIERNVVDDAGDARAAGDTALACADGAAFAAFVNIDDGQVFFGQRVAGDVWSFTAVDGAAAGGVSLAVDDDRATVAWVSAGGGLRVVRAPAAAPESRLTDGP